MAKTHADERRVKVKVLFDGHMHADKPVPRGSEIDCTQHEADYIENISRRRAPTATLAAETRPLAGAGTETLQGDN